MFILALHMFIVIDLIRLAQMKHGSFLLLYLCQMFVHLSLKLGDNKSTHLFSTMFTLGLEALNNFHTKATKVQAKVFHHLSICTNLNLNQSFTFFRKRSRIGFFKPFYNLHHSQLGHLSFGPLVGSLWAFDIRDVGQSS
jgi:hypothetical protein